MLVELHVTDLGIVDEITLPLDAGLTAITGETGAGKTLLVEALELLLGGRADPSLVRDGALEARVEGRFMGRDGEEHVLARVLPADGRSRAYIDGRLATAGELSEVGNELVDLHGQHTHQSLLAPSTQRAALDEYAGAAAADALAALRTARADVRGYRADLDGLGGDERARREADLLRFQVDEIDAAEITGPDEDDALRDEEAMLSDAVAIREALESAYHSVEGSAVDALGASVAALADREMLAEHLDRTKRLQSELVELGHDLRHAADGVVDDPARLEVVRLRRQLLKQMRRKYGETLAEVLAYRDEVRDRLAQLEHHDAHASRLAEQIAAADRAATVAAATLTAARESVAPALGEAVTQHLHELAMPKAQLSVAIEPGEITDDGADVVTFLLAANAGESARPVAKAASGGELARAMLALRLVCSDAPPTLVFDEVDAGIGGEAGTAVGRLLGVLGRTHQVLCVTHLAQVAAFADQQVMVEKAETGDRTVTRAGAVDGDARVRELSRMLAGVETSDHARGHAAELLAAARPAPSKPRAKAGRG